MSESPFNHRHTSQQNKANSSAYQLKLILNPLAQIPMKTKRGNHNFLFPKLAFSDEAVVGTSGDCCYPFYSELVRNKCLLTFCRHEAVY